jgi:hypothetical protein
MSCEHTCACDVHIAWGFIAPTRQLIVEATRRRDGFRMVLKSPSLSPGEPIRVLVEEMFAEIRAEGLGDALDLDLALEACRLAYEQLGLSWAGAPRVLQ